jgi:hypothetical protein
LRDHVAGALDADAVAGPDDQVAESRRIVERRIGDVTTPTLTGFSARPASLAGSADLDVDRLQDGLGFLGWEFVRQRPAAARAHEAERC